MIIIDGPTIARLLPIRRCIDLMFHAMSSLSAGATDQMPRQILPTAAGVYGVMGGVLPNCFGSKLISVAHSASEQGQASHKGVVILFDPRGQGVRAILEAGAITAIRTAAASAVATDVLARPNARSLAILGTGEQAYWHAVAIPEVRRLEEISIWGRSADKARHLAERIYSATGIHPTAHRAVADCVYRADIICTVTSASEPILFGRDVQKGAHVNLVGSGYAGPTEVDDDLVAAASYFGDSRESVRSQGAEFLRARQADRIAENHFLGEIGDVILGHCRGRVSPDEITLYKSLGHIAQDLIASEFVAEAAELAGEGVTIELRENPHGV